MGASYTILCKSTIGVVMSQQELKAFRRYYTAFLSMGLSDLPKDMDDFKSWMLSEEGSRIATDIIVSQSLKNR